MSEFAETIVFAALAVFCVVGGIAMLSTRNVIHAAFWLLGISAAVAGLFALLEAHYVALMQLLIYAGAVAILNIFTIMITLRSRNDAIRARDFSLPGLFLAAAFFALVAVALVGGSVTQSPSPDSFPGIVEFGEMLFSIDSWAFPFEVASLVLTAALVAAVWWTREEDKR